MKRIQNIKEKILDLASKYANDNGQFHKENPVSLKREIIERELKEFIMKVYLKLSPYLQHDCQCIIEFDDDKKCNCGLKKTIDEII